jgi:hypothetical protein
MKASDLASSLTKCHMREVLLEKHGLNGPSTHRRNNNKIPIDGIWASPGIEIVAGGYFGYDQVFDGTDHRCLWVDITYISAFGHNMPAIIRPPTRRLHCKDPRVVANFNYRLKEFYHKNNFFTRVAQLDLKASYPSTSILQADYEELDTIRCKGIAFAERKCRKLRMGQLAFSLELQKSRNTIYAWRLLIKRAKGEKVSSRLLTRTLRKAVLNTHMKLRGRAFLEDQLISAYKQYYSIKKCHRELRNTSLDNRAEALAQEGNIHKSKIIKALRENEKQHQTARKIKFLRGKLAKSSTTIVTVPDGNNAWKDLTCKTDIEEAILKSNEESTNNHFIPHFTKLLFHPNSDLKVLLLLQEQY